MSATEIRNRSREAFAKFTQLVPFPDGHISYNTSTLAALLDAEPKNGFVPRALWEFLGGENRPLSVNCFTEQGRPNHRKTLQIAQGEGRMIYPLVKMGFDSRGFGLEDVHIHHGQASVTKFLPAVQHGYLATASPEFLAGTLEVLAADAERGRERWIEHLRESRQGFLAEAFSRLEPDYSVVSEIMLAFSESGIQEEFIVVGNLPERQDRGVRLLTTLPVKERLADNLVPHLATIPPSRVGYVRGDFVSRTGRLKVYPKSAQIPDINPQVTLTSYHPRSSRSAAFPGYLSPAGLVERHFADFMAGTDHKFHPFGLISSDYEDKIALLLVHPNTSPVGPIFGE